MNVQYWVVYAFLTVIESAISAAYWFRKFWIPPLVFNERNGLD